MYPIGKLPAKELARLLNKYAPTDPRLIVGGKPGHDAAVIDMGDRYLVAKTDPITFATDEIGWYAVNINANDVACTGATPRWFLATLLLPENQTSVALVETIFEQIHQACRQLNISVAGGHTEITYGLNRPIVVGQLLGEVAPDKLITPKGIQVGDILILTKGIAVEATAIIATEKKAQLRDQFGMDNLNHYANFLHEPGISVVKDATIAANVGGIHAMHDPTEGGIATGLHELADAGHVGLEIDETSLPFLPETVTLCSHFGLDPLGVIASGALLIAADPQTGPQIVNQLSQNRINAAIIGRTKPPEFGRLLVSQSSARSLPTFARDEITRLFE